MPQPMTTTELVTEILDSRETLICQDCHTQPTQDGGVPVRVACDCASVYPTGNDPDNPDSWNLQVVA